MTVNTTSNVESSPCLINVKASYTSLRKHQSGVGEHLRECIQGFLSINWLVISTKGALSDWVDPLRFLEVDASALHIAPTRSSASSARDQQRYRATSATGFRALVAVAGSSCRYALTPTAHGLMGCLACTDRPAAADINQPPLAAGVLRSWIDGAVFNRHVGKSAQHLNQACWAAFSTHVEDGSLLRIRS